MIALQQRHGSILCMCYFQGAVVEAVCRCSELPSSACQHSPGLHFFPYSAPTLFVTLKSLLWLSQGPLTNQGELKTGSTRALSGLCKIHFFTQIFFLTTVVLIHYSFCRQYFLCQFGIFHKNSLYFLIIVPAALKDAESIFTLAKP